MAALWGNAQKMVFKLDVLGYRFFLRVCVMGLNGGICDLFGCVIVVWRYLVKLKGEGRGKGKRDWWCVAGC